MMMLLYIRKLKEGEGEKKSKGDCCVFGFAKVTIFFLQKHILHFGRNWVCQVSFQKEFLK
jgi:hypothetical protein